MPNPCPCPCDTSTAPPVPGDWCCPFTEEAVLTYTREYDGKAFPMTYIPDFTLRSCSDGSVSDPFPVFHTWLDFTGGVSENCDPPEDYFMILFQDSLGTCGIQPKVESCITFPSSFRCDSNGDYTGGSRPITRSCSPVLLDVDGWSKTGIRDLKGTITGTV